MTWVVTAIVVSTAVTMYGQVQQGKAQQEALEQRAKDEKFKAQGQELKRRQELNKVLAANTLSMMTSGTTSEGTPASIALEGAKAVDLSEGVIGLSSKLREAQLKRQGDIAKHTGYTQATSSLLSGVTSIAGYKA
ncbi:MAG: hypothetical protein NZ730_06710 [Porticoccaceae bacterium]|nr:hypothetical protein [Porticoccaceae bacterium]